MKYKIVCRGGGNIHALVVTDEKVSKIMSKHRCSDANFRYYEINDEEFETLKLNKRFDNRKMLVWDK